MMRKILTPEQIADLEQQQVLQQASWKNRPEQGETIAYLGRDFIVLPHVFPPGQDSMVLAENMPDVYDLSVLDMATGCGVMAIWAALEGAARVTAVDINPRAVACARLNCKQHGVQEFVTVEVSDLFDQVPVRHFDVITANLPFRKKYAPDMVAASQWDTDFALHARFFNEVINFIAPSSRIYMPLSNYPELKETLELARDAGLQIIELEKKAAGGDDPQDYYLFEMTLR